MRYTIALVALLSGCASMRADRIETVNADTYAEPRDAAENVRKVLSYHRFPVQSGGQTMVDTGYFEALSIWRPREVYAFVSCHLRGDDDLVPPRGIMMKISVTIRSGIRGIDAQGTPTPGRQALTTLQLRGSGRRQDGARCKLTDEYARQLVEEMAGLGGRPPLRAGQ